MIFICQINASSTVMPKEVAKFLDNPQNSVTEDGIISGDKATNQLVEQFVITSWKEILASWRSVAPDNRTQCLIVTAAESLPPREYVAFCNRVLDFQSSTQASGGVVHCILGALGPKRNFLAYNYDHPQVKEILSKLEILMAPGTGKQSAEYFSDIKCGKLKHQIVELHIQDNDQPVPESLADFSAGIPEETNAIKLGHPIEFPQPLNNSSSRNLAGTRTVFPQASAAIWKLSTSLTVLVFVLGATVWWLLRRSRKL